MSIQYGSHVRLKNFPGIPPTMFAMGSGDKITCAWFTSTGEYQEQIFEARLLEVLSEPTPTQSQTM